MPDWGVEDWYIDTIHQVPALAGLFAEFTPKEIWDAGFAVLGHPSTWEPSEDDVAKMKFYISQR